MAESHQEKKLKMKTKILFTLYLVFSLQTVYSQLSFPYAEFETRHDLYNYLSCYYHKTGSYSHLKEKHLMIYNNCENGKPIVQGVILQNSDSLNKFQSSCSSDKFSFTTFAIDGVYFHIEKELQFPSEKFEIHKRKPFFFAETEYAIPQFIFQTISQNSTQQEKIVLQI